MSHLHLIIIIFSISFGQVNSLTLPTACRRLDCQEVELIQFLEPQTPCTIDRDFCFCCQSRTNNTIKQKIEPNFFTLTGEEINDSLCRQLSCISEQVKAIRLLSSDIIRCIKYGTGNRCKCCFNSTLTIEERSKHEAELFGEREQIVTTQRPLIDPRRASTFETLLPPSLPPHPDQSRHGIGHGGHDRDDFKHCAFYQCRSDLFNWLKLFSHRLVQCSNYKSACRCCLNVGAIFDKNDNEFTRDLWEI